MDVGEAGFFDNQAILMALCALPWLPRGNAQPSGGTGASSLTSVPLPAADGRAPVACDPLLASRNARTPRYQPSPICDGQALLRVDHAASRVRAVPSTPTTSSPIARWAVSRGRTSSSTRRPRRRSIHGTRPASGVHGADPHGGERRPRGDRRTRAAVRRTSAARAAALSSISAACTSQRSG